MLSQPNTFNMQMVRCPHLQRSVASTIHYMPPWPRQAASWTSISSDKFDRELTLAPSADQTTPHSSKTCHMQEVHFTVSYFEYLLIGFALWNQLFILSPSYFLPKSQWSSNANVGLSFPAWDTNSVLQHFGVPSLDEVLQRKYSWYKRINQSKVHLLHPTTIIDLDWRVELW